MYKFSYLKEELLYLESHLKKAKIFGDSRILINESQECKIITWRDYDQGILKTHYLKTFRNAVSNRQYSYQFKDGSFLQFYYDFQNLDTLKKAKLAYYPLPNICSDVSEEDFIEYLEKYECDDIDSFIENYELTNTAHIRIDYDKDVTSHDICEVQFDGIKEIRIPCSILINPIYFLDFILKCKATISKEYKEAYSILKNDIDFKTKLNVSRKKCLQVENFSNKNIFISFLEQD